MLLALSLLTITVLLFGSGLVGYFTGYNEGHTAGEKEGHEIGYSQGFETGKETGYKDGYTEGQQAGYEAGYDVGFKGNIVSGITVQNPTYQQMENFLAQDKTDTKQYLKGQYVCSDYATEVNNNAEAQGIRCAVVELRYPDDMAHAIIAFQTVDKGTIYIEPQFDKEVNVAVGQSYSRINGYQIPPYDDTISRILFMW